MPYNHLAGLGSEAPVSNHTALAVVDWVRQELDIQLLRLWQLDLVLLELIRLAAQEDRMMVETDVAVVEERRLGTVPVDVGIEDEHCIVAVVEKAGLDALGFRAGKDRRGNTLKHYMELGLRLVSRTMWWPVPGDLRKCFEDDGRIVVALEDIEQLEAS